MVIGDVHNLTRKYVENLVTSNVGRFFVVFNLPVQVISTPVLVFGVKDEPRFAIADFRRASPTPRNAKG